MPDPEDPAEAAARLESALDRIAARAGRPLPTPPIPVIEADIATLAARLDRVIARLRTHLAPHVDDPADEAGEVAP